MDQNTMRALPGSFSGGRSTIAEYSLRSRGIMGVDIKGPRLSSAHSRGSGNPGLRTGSPLLRGRAAICSLVRRLHPGAAEIGLQRGLIVAQRQAVALMHDAATLDDD